MENENEIIDSTTDTVEETVETPEDAYENLADEEVSSSSEEVDVEQLLATNKKLYERAKKAEALLKAQVKPVLKPVTKAQTVPTPNVEETVLLATGMPEELLGELKAVAQVRNTSLIKAQHDPIFTAIKEKFERDSKQRDASLPAARSAGQVKAKKAFDTPGLSAEEHRALWESQNK
jgi:hypothetical protein